MKQAVRIYPEDFGDTECWGISTQMPDTYEIETGTEQNAVYTIYARLYQGSKSFSEFAPEMFGACPKCGKSSGRRNLGAVHVGYCLAHKTKWYAGENLFANWKLETESQWFANEVYLQKFRGMTRRSRRGQNRRPKRP